MFAALIRLLQRQPAAVGSAASLTYGAGVMLYRAFWAHTGVLDVDLLAAAAGAVWGLYTWTQVTPLANPRDAKGRSLHPL